MGQGKKSSIKVMLGLIGLVKPLAGHMVLAIFMGVIGNLSATFLTILGGYGILSCLGMEVKISFQLIVGVMIALGILRGVFRYIEQTCNHYIAFRLLANIRHQLFEKLRSLAPAKLEGEEKGNLISVITSDIELLEVFYAHTISPVCIAILTSVIMVAFIGSQHVVLGIVALCFYIAVGIVIPYLNGRLGATHGQVYRSEFGNLNTIVLDNLRGLKEILQYGQEEQRGDTRQKKEEVLGKHQKKLSDFLGRQQAVTQGGVLLAGVTMIILGGQLYETANISMIGWLTSVVAMMSSFGPTVAISSLSNDLNKTLACGNRVLSLLEEEPLLREVEEGLQRKEGNIEVKDASFAYDKKKILDSTNVTIKSKMITGIYGPSGCGKSTLLKLMMRFFQVDDGGIYYDGDNVNEITTDSLRKSISYISQDTFLFADTLLENIRISRPEATLEDVIEASKKASIHDFISSLPEGYETSVTELGSSLSGGERQRIGMARAFLHDGESFYMDEPTSNLDSLNEAVFLKSIVEESKDKTIVLVTHRKSSLHIADCKIQLG